MCVCGMVSLEFLSEAEEACQIPEAKASAEGLFGQLRVASGLAIGLNRLLRSPARLLPFGKRYRTMTLACRTFFNDTTTSQRNNRNEKRNRE